MTCQEIYERIWTDALRECSPAVRNAIDRHASQCPRCRSALRIVEDMTLALNRLEEPEPERELSAAIMARVARLPSARASSAGAEESRATSSGVMSWVWILAGVAIVAAERTTATIVGVSAARPRSPIPAANGVCPWREGSNSKREDVTTVFTARASALRASSARI